MGKCPPDVAPPRYDFFEPASGFRRVTDKARLAAAPFACVVENAIDNSHPPSVRFGTGTGTLPPVTYGQMADAHITDQIDAGQQASLDRSDGLGGQFDFTIGIGPLCLVACYLIINPGASFQNSVSSTEIDLAATIQRIKGLAAAPH